jgi:hypothetical protein
VPGYFEIYLSPLRLLNDKQFLIIKPRMFSICIGSVTIIYDIYVSVRPFQRFINPQTGIRHDNGYVYIKIYNYTICKCQNDNKAVTILKLLINKCWEGYSGTISMSSAYGDHANRAQCKNN